MTETHTPLPWTAERDLPHNRMPRVHSSADGSLICECGNMGTTQKQWEANAAFIVQAVNSHHRLVEALRGLAGNAGALRAFEWEIREACGNTNWQCLMDAIAKADAALKEAGRG